MSNSAGTFVYKIENDADRSVKHKSGRPSEKITAYRVNTTTGGLTPIPDSSFATHGPASITVNPTGTFLYLVNTVYVANTANMVIMGDIPHELENGNITAFRINSATGALTPVRGGPFAEGKRPLSITINPTGTFAFVATQEDKWQGQQCSIQAYHIDSTTGALVHSTSNSSSAVPIFCFETIRIIQP